MEDFSTSALEDFSPPPQWRTSLSSVSCVLGATPRRFQLAHWAQSHHNSFSSFHPTSWKKKLPSELKSSTPSSSATSSLKSEVLLTMAPLTM